MSQTKKELASKTSQLAKKTTNEDDVFTKVSDNTIINKKTKVQHELVEVADEVDLGF